jgi:hypothetical protein
MFIFFFIIPVNLFSCALSVCQKIETRIEEEKNTITNYPILGEEDNDEDQELMRYYHMGMITAYSEALFLIKYAEDKH